jgi:hypothetical protein
MTAITLAISLHAQSAPTVVPIRKEGHHHLVLENDYVRVYSVEVAPHSETLYHQHDLDYIFVTLGDSDVDSVRVGEPPAHLLLKVGDVGFTKSGFADKAMNNSDKPFKNVTIELKTSSAYKWEPCSFGVSCKTRIRVGSKQIGESTLLGNINTISAFSYTLEVGGSTKKSFIVSDGPAQSVLVIAVSRILIGSAGTFEQIKDGETRFYSEDPELEVSAKVQRARWITIRFP